MISHLIGQGFSRLLSRAKRAGFRQGFVLTVGLLPMLFGCAHLHHIQLSDIDNSEGAKAIPFDIKVSETGVDLGEAVRIQRGLFQNSKAAEGAGNIAAIVALFQQGPHTGNPVYSNTYAEKLIYALYQECPSGQLTGLSSIRETRKYPVVSGEIVRIKGFCLTGRPVSTAKKGSE
jgi:hypothetical protein